MILDAGFLMLDFQKILFYYNAKDGIFDQHPRQIGICAALQQASSIKYRFAYPPVYVSHRLVGLRRSFAIYYRTAIMRI